MLNRNHKSVIFTSQINHYTLEWYFKFNLQGIRWFGIKKIGQFSKAINLTKLLLKDPNIIHHFVLNISGICLKYSVQFQITAKFVVSSSIKFGDIMTLYEQVFNTEQVPKDLAHFPNVIKMNENSFHINSIPYIWKWIAADAGSWRALCCS